MANFAVAASDEVINQGNRLLEKMALPGEKKADTLSRIFQIVSDNIDNTQMKQGGIDVQALDASLSNIRTMFLASVTGKVLLTADFVQNHPVLFVQNQPIFLSARDFFQIPGGHFSTILSGVLIHMQL